MATGSQTGERQATGGRSSSSINGIVASGVRLEDIDLGGRTSPDGAVTIIFTDIEGSTEIVEQLGDERWFEILRAHNELIRDAVSTWGGSEVKHQGDGFMLAFTSARAGLRCAIDIQRRMTGFSAAQSEATMRVRIGLHSGFMIADGDDFVGRSVILAARIADRARGGEILVSDMLKDYVSTDPSFSFQDGQQLSLKGLSGMHTVHPVGWRS